MASVNKVILIGNLGRDPETRYTTGGDAITNLNIATTEQWKDKSGEKQEKTEWHRVVLFGRQAEIAGEYLKKGRSVYIEGRLQTRKYTDKDGVEKYSTEIVGDRMQLLGGREGGAAAATSSSAARAAARARRRRRRWRQRRWRRSGGGGGRREIRRRRAPSGPDPDDPRRRHRRRFVRRPPADAFSRRPSPATDGAVASARRRRGDHAAAQADVAVVEHEVLPRRRRPLRGVEARAAAPVVAAIRRGRSRRASGSASWRRGASSDRVIRRRPGDPVQLLRVDDRPVEQRMVVALHDDERVARVILARDEPRQVAAFLRPADPQPLPLAERVVGETVMAPDDRAVRRFDRPRCPRQILRQEVAKRPLADEADARRVLLGPGRNAFAARDRAHFPLRHFPERKQHRRELLLRQLVQEVALVLGRVEGLQQLDSRAAPAHPRIVTGRDVVGTQRARMVEEGAELDLAVAQHVRVRRAAGARIRAGNARIRARGTRARS